MPTRQDAAERRQLHTLGLEPEATGSLQTVILVSCELYENKTFRVSRKNYLAYVRKATLDLDDLGQGKLVGCRTNFNRSKIFLSPSFVEVLQLGIVAKKQGFPKL